MGKKNKKKFKNTYIKPKPIKQKKKDIKKRNKKICNIKQQQKEMEEIEEDDFLSMLYEGYDANIPHDKFNIVHIPETKNEHIKNIDDLIHFCDILIEIVDCRNIEATRIPEIEDKVIANKKKLILLINKVDLISDKDLNIISTKAQSQNLFFKIIENTSFKRESIQNFIDQLIICSDNLHSNISPKKNKKIKAGIFGYPNMGKNFIMNALKLIPNVDLTKKIMWFNDNKKLGIYSIPGTYYAENEEKCVFFAKTEKDFNLLNDPISIIDNVFDYVDKDSLYNVYGITVTQNDVNDLLKEIQIKFNYNNLNQCAAHLIKDLNSGNINIKITY